MASHKIFLSYRRDDSEEAARSIGARLYDAFGKANVYIDVHKFLVTRDFRKSITKAIEDSHAIMVVIGPKWCDEMRKKKARGETDWVRFEIEKALERDLEIVVVLVRGAVFPPDEFLPPPLRPLRWCGQFDLPSGANQDFVLDGIIEKLKHVGAARRPPFSPQQRRSFAVLALCCLVVFSFFAWRELLPARRADGVALRKLLHDNLWVSYDPSETTRNPEGTLDYPGVEVIEGDLDAIKQAGFSGIVTAGSNGVMAEVPRLAQKRGLRVIMGVWDPSDKRELYRAMRQGEHVDAYTIGESQGRKDNPLALLSSAIRYVKIRTGKPAAFSDIAKRYDDAHAELGDWLFPDAHMTLVANQAEDAVPSSRHEVSVEGQVVFFMRETSRLSDLARRHDLTLVFKNVAYPYDGIQGASREAQAAFYAALLAWMNDPHHGHSVRTSIVPQTAFDCPWKTAMRSPLVPPGDIRFGVEFLPWDPYTGLLMPAAAQSPGGTADKADPGFVASPAIAALLRWYPHLRAVSALPP